MPPENLERFFFFVFSILVGLVASASFLCILYFLFYDVTSFYWRTLLVAGFFVFSAAGSFLLSWTARDRWQEVPYTNHAYDMEQPIESSHGSGVSKSWGRAGANTGVKATAGPELHMRL